MEPCLPLIRRIISEAIYSTVQHVVVVLGYEAQRLKDSISDLVQLTKVSVVLNREYEKGLSSSIKVGLEHVSKEYDHVLILLADMVHIDRTLIDSFLQAYLESGAPLGAVMIEGKRSHPVIFSREFFRELISLKGDVGGRELFRKHHATAFFWHAPPGVKELDIDTPEDYAQLIKPFHKNS